MPLVPLGGVNCFDLPEMIRGDEWQPVFAAHLCKGKVFKLLKAVKSYLFKEFHG